MQRIIFPWETRKWAKIVDKINEPMLNIVDLDARISCLSANNPTPVKIKQITGILETYFSDTQYEKDRPSKDLFINKIIPYLQALVCAGPRVFKGFKSFTLAPNVSTNILVNRPQAATLIACMWFGLFDYNYLSSGNAGINDYPEPTLLKIWDNPNLFGLQCIINYFVRVYKYTSAEVDEQDRFEAGNIILKRHVLVKEPDWFGSNLPITESYIGDGTVDNVKTKMHVAYAHDIIGGDLFCRAFSQEEIILLVRPECLISLLFCARMGPMESVTILGAEKMSEYVGYGSSARMVGNYVDQCELGYNPDSTEVMYQTSVIFIDACKKTASRSQFIDDFDRDLTKAYCGFTALTFSKPGTQIASGAWSYGFNGCNLQLKCIQQILAASQANKCIVYCPPGCEFEDRLYPFLSWLKHAALTVGELYIRYVDILRDSGTGPNARLDCLDLFSLLMDS